MCILIVKEILYRNLDKEVFYREFAQGSCHRDLLIVEILYRELLERSCTEIWPSALLQRSCQQSSYREVVRRSLDDVAKRQMIDL